MEVVLQPLVELLLSNVQEHAEKALYFKSEVEKLQQNLYVVNDFLDACNHLNDGKKILTRISILLRNLMRDADDILTQCRIRNEYNRATANCMGNWLFRLQMGGKLENMNSDISTLIRDNGLIGLVAGIDTIRTNNHQAQARGGRRKISLPYIDPDEAIVGLEADVKKIRSWISDSDDGPRPRRVNWIGIVGMGGLGKTTLVQQVYESFSEKKIWVSVSQDFDGKDMLCRVLLKLGGKPDQHDDEESLMGKIRQELSTRSFLIVLDDVWPNGVQWLKKFRSCIATIPAMPKDSESIPVSSCSVIVTTRSEEVASSLKMLIHKHEKLSDEDSFSLFSRHAFKKNESPRSLDEIKDVADNIVKKCGGLPLALKTIGALLRGKPASEWRKINQETFFRAEIVEVMDCLQLSYDDLPSHLKQCLLSFSVFPEDAVIEAEKLIRWWVGESLIHDPELGYEYLSDLASRCLIEPQDRGVHSRRLYNCKMHDMVRELTIKIAQDEGFCKFDSRRKGESSSMVKPQWLGLTDQVVERNYMWDSKLRALLLVSPTTKFNLVMRKQIPTSLRVLDLSPDSNQNIVQLFKDAKEIDNLWAWISSLQLLAYLNLSGIEGLTKLPSSIRKLRNLQVLIVRECKNLKQVRPSIASHLKKLVVLDFTLCPLLTYLPRGLDNFSNLQELSGFTIPDSSQVGEGKCFQFADLNKLKNLRVLRIRLTDASVLSELTALKNLDNLKVLSIKSEVSNSMATNTVDFPDDHIYSILDGLSPPPNLEELHLKMYRRRTLWTWINPTQLPKLTYLCIEQGNLESLSRQISGESKIWKSVEGLCLKHLQKLTEHWVTLRENIMPSICSLEVSRCTMLQKFPCSTDELGVWYHDDHY